MSPKVAAWISTTFGVEAVAVRDLGLREADDPVIFAAARKAGAIVMTKDGEFLDLVARLGTPPQVIWITCGNTSNARLKEILTSALPGALELLKRGERIVEVSDAKTSVS